MAEYRYKAPDGETYLFRGPGGLSQRDVDLFGQRYFNVEPAAPVQQQPKPQGEMGFIPSVKRGALGLESLLADVAPAMVAKGLGYDEYATKQMQEAAATQKEIQEKYPAEVASFTEIDSPGKALTYIKEAIGEAIPSIIPSLLTGGAAGVASRGATAAAMQAAESVAAKNIAQAMAAGPLQAATLEGIKKTALDAGIQEARKVALKYQATGALAGSAAQNVPDVYQNVYEAGGTDRTALIPALVGGAFNSVLDAVTPLNILRKAKVSGIPESEIIGAWYKRAGRGAVEGFATEGGTEALQEMSSAAAERFVNENKQFFTPENFTRFIDAGLKGGFGGAGITAASNVAFGRAEPEQRITTPAGLPEAPKLTPEQEELAKTGINVPTPEQTYEFEQETPPTPTEGAADVGQPDTTTGGESPVVSEPAGDVAPTPTGTEPSDGLGVVPAGQDVTSPAVGEEQAPATVAEEAPTAEAPAPTEVVSEEAPAPEDQTARLDALTQKAQALGIETAPIEGALSREEIDQRLAAIEEQIGERYNEERDRAAYPDDDTVSLVEALEKGQLPPQYGFTGQKYNALVDILKRNGIEDVKAYEDLAPEEVPDKLDQLLKDLQKRQVLRKWGDLTADQREVFLDALSISNVNGKPTITPRSRDEAIKKLMAYTKQMERTGKSGEVKAAPAASVYERERPAMEKALEIKLPKWADLPDDIKARFTKDIEEATTGKGKKKVIPQDAVDRAFVKLGTELVGRKLTEPLSENVTARQAAVLKETEQESLERAQREIAATEEQRKNDEKRRQHSERIGKTKFVPDHVVQQIKKGNFEAVMQYLRTAAQNKLHKQLAQKIYGLGLKTKIKFVDTLPKGRLAEYDPKTDTISVTSEGLRDTILLHEIVHAASINVINKYLKGGKGLTQEQFDAADHLNDLMEHTKEYLGKNYPDAYKNLYEFVSYAMSDPLFQDSLANVPMDTFATTILPDNKSAWSEFVAGIVKVLGWGKQIFTGKGEVKKDVALLEALGAFEDVMLAPPEGGIEMAALPATITAPTPAMGNELEEALKEVRLKEHGGKRFLRNLFTKRGAEWAVTMFQNERYPLKVAEDRAARFGILSRIGDSMNNVYGQISRAAGIAVNLFETRVKNATDEVHKAVEDYAQTIGVEPKEALARLHLILEALHEPERRMVKFLMRVPLDDDKKFTVKGINESAKSAEGWRQYILKELAQPKDVDAKGLRRLLNQIALDPQFHSKIIRDEKGKVLKLTPEQEASYFDPNSAMYNVIAQRTPQELNSFLLGLVPGVDLQTRTMPDNEQGRAIQKVIDGLEKVKTATTELNKEANYYSKPVANIIDFYGFEHYVPFKGKPGAELINEEFNIESRYIGGELQEAENAFEGRMSESENPLLQILADGATSALRAGRKDLMKSIENAVGDKILRGHVQPQTIKFEERYLQGATKAELGGPNKIFIYQPDGSIKIVEINDPKQREALRRSYRMTQPLLDYANMATSTLGQMHTRYNPAFAPMNFVRDALTNAFTLGAELGPNKAGKLLTAVASDVAGGGMRKALNFSNLHANGKFDEIDRLAKTDPYYQDMKDYIAMGGKVSYLQGVAAKGALEELIKEVGRSGVMKKKEQVDKFVDIWNEMFELSSRTAAYRLLRDEFYTDNRKKGMKEADALADAQVHAVEYAKNLANFEQVGRWGKGMGALFMFFRPAATGAVRAIESLAPAFRMLPPGMGGFDEKSFREEAAAEGRSGAQIDKAVEQMKREAQYAAHMAFSLLGVGAAVYLMAMLMSGEDDAGRNKVATDDMARWTRYARFHVPGTDFIFQIPWGFGLGSFASAGAQMMSLVAGRSSFSEVASNIIDLGTDSFLPLPISRISIVDNPAAKFMDTVTPSMFRPFFEYVMNLDGLGREIYNNRQTRYGDAFTGGDNIPEMYKMTARWLFNATNGGIDWSPNTMYFFANNYADGLAKVAAASTDGLMLAAGQKPMDESALKSMPLISSFIGSKSNYDARAFSKFEEKIKATDKRLEALKNQPEKFSAYVEAHPADYALVETYNMQVNGALRQIRAMANQVRANPDLSPKERKEQLKELVDTQNILKRNMLEVFKEIETAY